MIYLWTIAGAIIGWVGIDIISGAIKCKVPILFNIGIAFVGGLTAYTIMMP